MGRHAGAYVSGQAVRGHGVAQTCFPHCLHTLDGTHQIVRLKGNTQFPLTCCAKLAVSKGRDPQTGLSCQECVTPGVSAGGFTHEGKVQFFISHILPSGVEHERLGRTCVQHTYVGIVDLASTGEHTNA